MDLKKSLINHIESILSASLNSADVIDFSVYDCINDEIPNDLSSVVLTQEFLVEIKSRKNTKDKVQKFLKKEIYILHFPDYYLLYWFEGNDIEPKPITTILAEIIDESDYITIDNVDKLKNYTHLPAWLDNFLFNELNAMYSPDYQRYDRNLDLTEDELKVYLGTYFPRSYSESFCILDNIFQNKKYKSIAAKETINILDIGAGTGGDLIGLLVAINKYSLATDCLIIHVIDGSSEALNILKNIISEFRFHCKCKIELNTIPQTIESINDIDLTKFNVKFDFILSFKMICEIINSGKGKYDNSYYEIVKKSLNHLSETGLFVLLDVTTKANHCSIFNPILMNTQINTAISESANYKTLIPLSCNHYEDICNEQCFTQRVFKITHKLRSENISKVTYRVIGQTNFIDKIIDRNSEHKHILMMDRFDSELNGAFCIKSNGDKIIDGYKL